MKVEHFTTIEVPTGRGGTTPWTLILGSYGISIDHSSQGEEVAFSFLFHCIHNILPLRSRHDRSFSLISLLLPHPPPPLRSHPYTLSLSVGRDRGSRNDREDKENEYLRPLNGTDPAPQNGNALSRPQIPQGQFYQQNDGNGESDRAGTGTAPDWLVKLPAVVGDKNNTNNFSSSYRPLVTAGSREARPRAKSATIGRRPGSIPPTTAGYLINGKDYRSNGNLMNSSGTSGGNNNYNNSSQRNRIYSDADGIHYSGGSGNGGNGGNVRGTTANGPRKPVPSVVSKLINVKNSEPLFSKSGGVADNRNQDVKRNNINYNQVPLAPREIAREEKLAYMYGDDVINHLDSVVANR